MPIKVWPRLLGTLAAIAVAAITLSAWRANRRDTAQLATDLAAAKQSLAQAESRQRDRDSQLLQTLAVFAAEKRNITTPTQIVHALPNEIPLPSAITLPPAQQPCNAALMECGGILYPEPRRAAALTSAPNHRLQTPGKDSSVEGKSAQPDQAILPIEDLKPLYDFTIDCKACQAKLAAAQADLSDERAKATALTHQRDEAVQVAKGGSVLRRIARNAKWLAIGVLAGAVAAKAHR
jgi:hypothetical protein